MEFINLQMKLRTGTGKGSARRIRRDGLVPAVIYGPGLETIKTCVAPADLTRALANPLHVNTVLAISLDKTGKDVPKEIHAIVRDHQYHPVSRQLLHVDFLAVDVSKPIQIAIPLEARGRSLGEQAGGTLTQLYREVPVECLPKDIPALLEIDVSELEINDHLRVSDLTLPEGVTSTLTPETSVVTVVAPRAEEEKPEEEEEGVEGEEGAEGEAGEGEGEKKGDEKPAEAEDKKE
jgi:large subunit ribosomal protein L25